MNNNHNTKLNATIQSVNILVLTLMFIFSPSPEMQAKVRIDTIATEEVYNLERPAASMTLDFNNDGIWGYVHEELIFDDGAMTPTLKVSCLKADRFTSTDTLLFGQNGGIVRAATALKNYKGNTTKVIIPSSKNRFNTSIKLPTHMAADKLCVTDFDKEGNWRKAYWCGLTDKTIISRSLSYKHTPEQSILLDYYRPILHDSEIEFQNLFESDLSKANARPFILAGLLAGFALLSLIIIKFMNSAWNGKMRWVLITIIGIPVLTHVLIDGVDLIEKSAGGNAGKMFLGTALVLYLFLGTAMIKSMNFDRRLGNGFISIINAIWSLWAIRFIAIAFTCLFFPNLWGLALGIILGIVIAAYTGHGYDRCPSCHNPHGMELVKQTLEGTETVTDIDRKSHRSAPKTTSVFASGDSYEEKFEVNTTNTTTVTTKTYQKIKEHFRCKECGYEYSGATRRGWMINKDSFTSSETTKEKYRLNINK